MALGLSAFVHGALAALAWVMSWWGFGGLSLPRREYAVEIVGVSADPSATPPLETPPADEPKKPEPKKPESNAEKADEAKVAKRKPRPKTPPDGAKDAKDGANAATATPPVKPAADDDGPVVAKVPSEATPPPAEDAIPWPLDDAEVAAASAVDLPGAAPGDAALLIAFRLDRLRDGPWAAHIERILAPMPDYQTIIAGSSAPMADLFDLLFVATPDVTDVTATFLAAHHVRTEVEVKATLAGTGKRPRVIWEPAPGGTLGKRTRGGGVLRDDPRVFLIPEAGWVVLARPEHLPGLLEAAPPASAADAGPGAALSADAGVGNGAPTPPATPVAARPRWMERLVTLVGDPKATNARTETRPTPGPIAILAVANLGKRLIVPGVGTMPAPAATVVSVFATADGFRVVGVMDFRSEQAARDFAAAATRTRDAALGSLVTRHFIAKVAGERALRQLTFVARGKQVAASTHVLAADARVMLDAAADWSLEWFEAVRRAQGAN